ncbi:MAG: hypothetical protein F4057_06360 [Acidobacteria bacterium]|nr:hypothetical protein [Rhodospirillaceae bacterium]MYI74938.1 hypothetical protein [Acidobacteriota bacterium]
MKHRYARGLAALLACIAFAALAPRGARAGEAASVSIQLLHPENHSLLHELESGDTLDLNALGVPRPVVTARVAGGADFVRFTLVGGLSGSVRRTVSRRPPHAMCGWIELDRLEFTECHPFPRSGPYVLTVTPEQRQPYRLHESKTVEFDVVRYRYGYGAGASPGGRDQAGPERSNRTGPSRVTCVSDPADCAKWLEHFDDDNYHPETGNRCGPGTPDAYRQRYHASGSGVIVTLWVECP